MRDAIQTVEAAEQETENENQEKETIPNNF